MRHLLPIPGTVVSASPATRLIVSVMARQARLLRVSLKHQSSRPVLDFYLSATMGAACSAVESVSVVANVASKLGLGPYPLAAALLNQRSKVSDPFTSLGF